MEKDRKISSSKISFLKKLKQLFFGSRKKAIITIIVLLVVGFFTWRTFAKGTAQPKYVTSQVQKGSVISTVSESGNVSGNEVNITSPTDGVITEIYVKNGEQVNAGDKLFKVKSTATPQTIASAYASYQNALNSYTSAKDNLQSLDSTMWQAQQSYLDAQNSQNYKNGNTTNPSTRQAYTDLEKESIDSAVIVAQKSFAAAEQKYKDGNMAVAASQAQLASAQLSYQATQDSDVIAPIAGTVANLSANIGSNVSASSITTSTSTSSSNSSSSSSSNAGSTVLEIANLSQLQILVQASEVDVPNIKAGQKATITLDAFSDKTFVGTVTGVDTIGSISSGVVTYNIHITFAYPPDGVQPGMTASVSIQTNRKDDVVYVPTSAIQTVNGSTYVRELQNGKLTQVPVEIGIASDSDTEITSGLSEGDTIVTSVVTTTSTANSTSSPFSAIGGGRGGFGGGGAVRGAAAGR